MTRSKQVEEEQKIRKGRRIKRSTGWGRIFQKLYDTH